GGTIAQFGSVNAYDTGVITIFGTSFNLPFGAISQTSGTLTGTLGDGSPIDVAFARFASGSIVLGKPAPTVSVTAPNSVYDGQPPGVTGATVTGIGSTVLASFGDPSLSYTYYVGATASGTGSTSAPTSAGTYTVVAHWTSNNPTYVNADSAPTNFTIAP